MMIKGLMELGVMVEPEAAKILNKGDASRITEKVAKMSPRPFSINIELAKQLVIEPPLIKTIRKAEEMKSMSVPDFSAGYNERYAALQKILLKSPALANIVSINSAFGECCIIGMVKNSGKIIEDPSGEGEFVTDAKLLDGDVIGASGTAEGGIFRAKEIIFPGVQLKERAGQSGAFTAGNSAGCQIRTNATAFYDVNGCIAVTSGTDLPKAAQLLGWTEKEAAIELLKRKRLMSAPKDYLEPQPDFLIFNTSSDFVENCKGVIIIGVKEGSTAEIDTGTRNARFLPSL